MRYNVFLLSGACFYFFMQTANLVLGAPADTHRESLTVDIAESDQSHPVIERNTFGTKSLEKLGGSGMGQQICASKTRRRYDLYMANCVDDLNYIAICLKTVPPVDRLTFDGMCKTDEICMGKNFNSLWTEVYCRKRMPITNTFQRVNTLGTSCSPGITAQDPNGSTIGISAQFYSNDQYTYRAGVSLAWIQTNKRDTIVQHTDVNGIYHQLDMVKGETAQACFYRAVEGDASFATLQWAQ